MRFIPLSFVVVVALSAAAMIVPAQSAAATGNYAVVDAKASRSTYPYLTAESVAQQLSPKLAGTLPAAASRRLVILNVTFKANGDPKAMVELDPTHLETRWTSPAGKGSAPVLGVHLSKDFIVMGSGAGFFTSMRPDSYEVFAIIPKGVTRLDLAQRQADGSYRLVKANIAVPAAR